jgi:hypothetical protein
VAVAGVLRMSYSCPVSPSAYAALVFLIIRNCIGSFVDACRTHPWHGVLPTG